MATPANPEVSRVLNTHDGNRAYLSPRFQEEKQEDQFDVNIPPAVLRPPRFYAAPQRQQDHASFRGSHQVQRGCSLRTAQRPTSELKPNFSPQNLEYSPAAYLESWVDKPLPQQPNSRWRRAYQGWNDLTLNTWLVELISWIFAVCCFAAAIIILSTWNNKPLHDLPQGITLNTLLTLFVTLATTALMVPVSQGISQLKWIWFSSDSRRALDFETFDSASRGVRGSIVLMAKLKWNHLSSLGALITIFVLAANTFAQQSIRYAINDKNQTVVEISWAWMAMLGFILVASLIFLICVMILNRRSFCSLWKTSNLALLQALDPQQRPVDFTGLKDISNLYNRAGGVYIRLRNDVEPMLSVGSPDSRRYSYRSARW